MNIFISRKSIVWKSGILSILLLCLAGALYLYGSATTLPNLITSMRPYYWKAYAIGLESRIFNPGMSSASQSSGFARSVPVISYHSLVDHEDGDNVLFTQFRDQMYALKEAGYETISLEDFREFMYGRKKVPDRSFLIVFDDGRKDSYYPADPILKALGYRASMAVILNRTEDRSAFFLTKAELKAMQKSGRWDIMSHGDRDHDLFAIDERGTMGHFMANKLWLADKGRLETEDEYARRIRIDLVDAKNRLEEMFGVSVMTYALPFSDYGQKETNYHGAKNHVLATMKDVYSLSFYNMWIGGHFLSNYPSATDQSHIAKRILVMPDWSDQDLLGRLESVRAKDPVYANDMRAGSIHGWTQNWGNGAYEGEYLRIGARKNTSGGSMFLDGSYDWQDYRVNATIDWKKGNSVLLLSRFEDDKNYVACAFFGDHVQIQQSLDGVQRVIKGTLVDLGGAPKNDLKISMSVNGRTVQCFSNDSLVVSSAFLDPVLSYGGIGFKTWDPRAGNSEIIVKTIGVTPLNGRGIMNLTEMAAQ